MRRTANRRFKLGFNNFIGAIGFVVFVIVIGLPRNIVWLERFGWTKLITATVIYSLAYAIMIYTTLYYDDTSKRKMKYRSSRTLTKRRIAVSIGVFCGLHLLVLLATLRDFRFPGPTTLLWTTGIALAYCLCDYLEQRSEDRRPCQPGSESSSCDY